MMTLVVGSRVLFGHSGDLAGFFVRSKWVRFLIFLGVLAATRARHRLGAIDDRIPSHLCVHHVGAARRLLARVASAEILKRDENDLAMTTTPAIRDLEGRAEIEQLVNQLLRRVRGDEVLGFIFNDVAKTNWETHLPKMYAFWETVVFRSGGYLGNPLASPQSSCAHRDGPDAVRPLAETLPRDGGRTLHRPQGRTHQKLRRRHGECDLPPASTKCPIPASIPRISRPSNVNGMRSIARRRSDGASIQCSVFSRYCEEMPLKTED